MSSKPRHMVHGSRKETPPARNLPDAANSDESIQGYAAVNALNGESEVARRAYELYLKRQETGEEGTADGDWFRAESEVRRGLKTLSAG